jgi:hypothetical protein
MDVTSVAVEALYKQGFGAIRPIGVLARPKDWVRRMDKRFKAMEYDEIAGRLDEARVSIEAIQDRWDQDNRLVIVSAPMREDINLEAMENYVQTGEVKNENLVRKVGKEMLDMLPSLYARYSITK